MEANILGAAYQFADVEDDFGERNSATLLGRNSRPHCEAQRSYKRKERGAVACDESARESCNTSR